MLRACLSLPKCRLWALAFRVPEVHELAGRAENSGIAGFRGSCREGSMIIFFAQGIIRASTLCHMWWRRMPHISRRFVAEIFAQSVEAQPLRQAEQNLATHGNMTQESGLLSFAEVRLVPAFSGSQVPGLSAAMPGPQGRASALHLALEGPRGALAGPGLRAAPAGGAFAGEGAASRFREFFPVPGPV